MQCYNCGAQLTEKPFCTNCRADVSNYKKLISFANYYYNQGLEKATVRDLSGAIDSLKLCLKINKYHIEARNLLGLVYFEMGESVAALSEWVISKNLSPEKNIADDYINSIQKSPSQLEAIHQASRKFNLALGYCYQDSKDLAVIQLKKLLADNPNFIQGHLLLALLYIDAAEWEKARKELTRCLRIDTANTMALRYMKEVDAALKLEEEARGGKRQAKKEEAYKYQSGNETIIQPINVVEQKRSGGWIWGLLCGLAVGVAAAVFLVLPAQVQNAKAGLNEQLIASNEELDKKSVEISTLTQQLEAVANENAQLKRQTEALAGNGGQMTTVETLLNAAYVYLETPEDVAALSEAMELIDRDVMESPETSEIARNLFVKLMAISGTDIAVSYYDIGYQAFRDADYDTAIENLKKAVEYDPDHEEALFALGNSYKEKGNKSQAIETYEKVIELFPDTQKAEQAAGYIEDLSE
ncbi:MAG: tetratricopeptide repeat protein [Lachnospiraceae bacterium]|nr:tetratricopeptide repeat protein [Lachnospiraceae bacterium]